MEALRLGKVTNQELTEWFSTTPTQIKNKKKAWLEKLKEYCSFDPVYGGVYIKEIYKPYYVKNKNLQITKEEFNKVWDKSGLDSCKRVSEEIYEKRHNDITVTNGTVYSHTIQVRNEFYGKPMCGQGLKGRCEYVWCKKNAQGHLEFLSPEEEKIKVELLKTYFGNADEKTVLVQQMIEKKELTEEAAWKYYSKIMSLPNNYNAFMDEFKKRTGIVLIKGTVIYNELRFAD